MKRKTIKIFVYLHTTQVCIIFWDKVIKTLVVMTIVYRFWLTLACPLNVIIIKVFDCIHYGIVINYIYIYLI